MKKILLFIGILLSVSVIAAFSNCTSDEEVSTEMSLEKQLETLVNSVNMYEGVSVDFAILKKADDGMKFRYIAFLDTVSNSVSVQ